MSRKNLLVLAALSVLGFGVLVVNRAFALVNPYSLSSTGIITSSTDTNVRPPVRDPLRPPTRSPFVP
jgi:hypothetical protein